MERKAIVVMVEDFWRSFIPVAFNGDQRAATLIVERFQKQIDDVFGLMPESERETFLGMVEEEREKLFREYNANPKQMKERLGVPDGHAAVARSTPARTSSRMGLSEVAVRSAVRATAWETIISIVRALRR